MNKDSPQKAIVVVLATALVCSIMVSVAAISLRPIQLAHKLLERARHVVQLTGLAPAGVGKLSDDELLAIFEQLDARVVNLDEQEFEQELDPATFDQRKAATDPERSVVIPTESDTAQLGRRSRFAIVYMVWEGSQLKRIVLPMHGQGMWSTIYGYLALDADLNTIAAVSFFEQAETPGLGDQILRAEWLAQWQGRKLLDESGATRFRIAAGRVEPGSQAARHEVDALSGASVTANGVTGLVNYWFGAHGFQPFLQYLRDTPPTGQSARLNKGD